MRDDLGTLEQLLREKAAEVPYVQAALPATLARARRRVARTALVSVAAAGLLVVGASLGVARLAAEGPDQGIPAVSPTGGPSVAPSTSVAPCDASVLRATASLDGAAGSVEGAIHVTNLGPSACSVAGRPVVTLFTGSGRPITVHVLRVTAQWQADGAAAPPGWPVVRLRPGGAASVRVRWSNACPQQTSPALWVLDLGSGPTLDVFGADGTSPPPCNGPGEPSTLEVGPFEPST